MTFIFKVSAVSVSLLACADTALTYLQTHLSLRYLSDVLSRRGNNTTFLLVHLYEFLRGCTLFFMICLLWETLDTRLLLHLLHWLYDPCWTLASCKIIFQAPVSQAIVLKHVKPIFFRSFPTSSKLVFLCFFIFTASSRVHAPYIPCTNKNLIIPFSSPGSFRNNRSVLHAGVISTTSSPQTRGPGYPF